MCFDQREESHVRVHSSIHGIRMRETPFCTYDTQTLSTVTENIHTHTHSSLTQTHSHTQTLTHIHNSRHTQKNLWCVSYVHWSALLWGSAAQWTNLYPLTHHHHQHDDITAQRERPRKDVHCIHSERARSCPRRTGTRIRTHIGHTNKRTHNTRTYTHTHTHTHTHIYMYVYTQYTHRHTHTHTPAIHTHTSNTHPHAMYWGSGNIEIFRPGRTKMTVIIRQVKVVGVYYMKK